MSAAPDVNLLLPRRRAGGGQWMAGRVVANTLEY